MARWCRSTGFAAAVLLAAGAAAAQSVTLNGTSGNRLALLVIDGVPRTLAIGQTVKGVKLLALDDGAAKIDVGGRQLLLRIGAAPVKLGGGANDGGGSEIVLTASSGGHFMSSGSINGGAVQFLVDTGATLVALSQADAERIGLRYREAERLVTHTANGPVPVHRVMLNSVRIGDVEIYNVEAAVVPAQMPFVLLGNSFLTRFQMKRENDRMTLVKRL
jgi:aspartyl protease family protein